MKEKIRKKTIGRICALVVVGMFVAMALSTPVHAPVDVDWYTLGNDPEEGDFLGTTTNEDLVIKTYDTTRMIVEGDGDLNVDSGTLFVDESADRVGIGTTNPGFYFEVECSGAASGTEYLLGGFDNSVNGGGVFLGYLGDGTDASEARVRSGGGGGGINLALGTSAYLQAIYILNSNGNVGIGTTGPDQKLDVLSTGTQLRLTHTDGSKYCDFQVDTNHDLLIKPSSTGQIKLQPTTDSTDFFQVLDADGGTPILNIDATNERAGIGTTSPGFNFEVESSGAASGTEYLLGGFDNSVNGGGVFLGYLGDGTDASEARVRSGGGGGGINLALGTSAYLQAIYILNSNGNVGIGTTNPTSKLHVAGGVNIDSGDLNVDSGTLFVDESTDRVGIGTTSPGFNFEVESSGAASGTEYLLGGFDNSVNGGGVFLGYLGDGTDASEARVRSGGGGGGINLALGTSAYQQAIYILNSNGNVGIGTNSPSNRLTVSGNADITGQLGIGTTSPGAKLHLKVDDSSTSGSSEIARFTRLDSGVERGLMIYSSDNSGSGVGFKVYNTGSEFFIADKDDTRNFVIEDNGNVGIGTTSPLANLHSLAATEQLRLGYDASNYASFTVASEGALTIQTTGTDADIEIRTDSFDNAIYIDDVWGYVGIGTESPNAKLEVNGNILLTSLDKWIGSNSNVGIYIKSGGFVGICNNNPSSELDVDGNIEIPINSEFYFGDPNTDGTWRIQENSDDLRFQRRESDEWVEKFRIEANP